MKHFSFRPLVCALLASLCFGAACGDDDGVPEPNFQVDEADGAANDDQPTGDTSTDDTGKLASTGVNSAAYSTEATPERDGGVDTSEGDAAAPDETGAMSDALTSDTPNETTSEATAGTNDTGESEDCVRNPTTHLELINACTTAVVIKKTPNLIGLNDDGSLPPLP